MNVDSQRFVRSDTNIDSEIKFVAINQERIRNILADNRGFVHIHIVNIINEIDTLSLA